jgi:hypothetical protein
MSRRSETFIAVVDEVDCVAVLHELLANADATESRDSDGVSVLVQVVMVVNRLKPTTLVVVHPDDSKTPVQSVEQQDYLRQSELNH